MTASRAWLFIRGSESVRIVVEGASVAVHGPGRRFSRSAFEDEMDAALYHASVEHELVLDGWLLEQLTTERRAGTDRRRTVRPSAERRRHIRLVIAAAKSSSTEG